MVKEIGKWRLKAPRTIAHMPESARVLSVQAIDGVPYLWALIDPSKRLVMRTFDVYGEGLPVREGKNIYIGSFTLMDGKLVFHVMEK